MKWNHSRKTANINETIFKVTITRHCPSRGTTTSPAWWLLTSIAYFCSFFRLRFCCNFCRGLVFYLLAAQLIVNCLVFIIALFNSATRKTINQRFAFFSRFMLGRDTHKTNRNSLWPTKLLGLLCFFRSPTNPSSTIKTRMSTICNQRNCLMPARN